MGIREIGSDCRVPRIDLELTSGCDHGCGHCYNVWNARPGDPQAGYPRGQLGTAETLALVDDALRQSGAGHVTITGGEPLLRHDALEIIEHVCARVPSSQLITNGSHVGPETAARLARAGLRSVQLTLLGASREKHDALEGATCFDDTVRAAVDLSSARVPVQVCFVAMRENWQDFEEVLELCLVLGVRSLSYNRMSPTGGAIHEIERLMPEVEHVEHNLESAERLGRRWGIRIGTAMPIPPCLIRLERYSWVKFGFCSTGTTSPNIVVDAVGNVRSCNLSSRILGNLRRESWAEIMADPYPRDFRRHVPDICRGCSYERSCNGGCKENSFAVTGRWDHPDPFVARAMSSGAVATSSQRMGPRHLGQTVTSWRKEHLSYCTSYT
jgi:pyrroloquinoline quinone biosynthesis protein E